MADQGAETTTNIEVPELHEDRNLNGYGNSSLQAAGGSVAASAPRPSAAAASNLVASPDRPLLAPMPGVIVRCETTLGEEVEIGDTVLLLEAMKMENPITAPISGKIVSICNEGAKVKKGDVLAVIR